MTDEWKGGISMILEMVLKYDERASSIATSPPIMTRSIYEVNDDSKKVQETRMGGLRSYE